MLPCWQCAWRIASKADKLFLCVLHLFPHCIALWKAALITKNLRGKLTCQHEQFKRARIVLIACEDCLRNFLRLINLRTRLSVTIVTAVNNRAIPQRDC